MNDHDQDHSHGVEQLESLNPTLRSPQRSEAVMVSGWGLAEGVRRAMRGNPMLDGEAIEAILERVELQGPFKSSIAPTTPMVMNGSLRNALDWCLPDTAFLTRLPSVEGLMSYLRGGGTEQTVYVPVERRHITLIEDPHDHWPTDSEADG